MAKYVVSPIENGTVALEEWTKLGALAVWEELVAEAKAEVREPTALTAKQLESGVKTETKGHEAAAQCGSFPQLAATESVIAVRLHAYCKEGVNKALMIGSNALAGAEGTGIGAVMTGTTLGWNVASSTATKAQLETLTTAMRKEAQKSPLIFVKQEKEEVGKPSEVFALYIEVETSQVVNAAASATVRMSVGGAPRGVAAGSAVAAVHVSLVGKAVARVSAAALAVARVSVAASASARAAGAASSLVRVGVVAGGVARASVAATVPVRASVSAAAQAVLLARAVVGVRVSVVASALARAAAAAVVQVRVSISGSAVASGGVVATFASGSASPGSWGGGAADGLPDVGGGRGVSVGPVGSGGTVRDVFSSGGLS